MAKKEISELINNLKTRKTAIIIGNKTNEECSIIEDNQDFYTRKKMVKEPESFWTGYFNAFFNKKYDILNYEKEIIRLINSNKVNIEAVINFSYRGNLPKKDNIINVNGEYNTLRCMQCDEEITITESFFDKIEGIKKCKKCSGKLSPTITMYEEKYKTYIVDSVTKSLFTTDDKGDAALNIDNLIVIDADFNESFTNELIDSFSALKAKNHNANLIIISKNQSEYINYHNADFATNDDIDASISRLLKLMEGEN